MKKYLALSLALLYFSAACYAQTPSELDDYYAKKAIADAAQQVIVRANAFAIEQVRQYVIALDARIAALEATVAKLQAAGVLTQQQLDAVRLVIPVKP